MLEGRKNGKQKTVKGKVSIKINISRFKLIVGKPINHLYNRSRSKYPSAPNICLLPYLQHTLWDKEDCRNLIYAAGKRCQRKGERSSIKSYRRLNFSVRLTIALHRVLLYKMTCNTNPRQPNQRLPRSPISVSLLGARNPRI